MLKSSPYGKSVEVQGRIGNQELTRAALSCGCALGWCVVGEPDLRRGEPLKAVAAHAGNVENCGAAVGLGRRTTPEFLGCRVHSIGLLVRDCNGSLKVSQTRGAGTAAALAGYVNKAEHLGV